MKNIILVLAAMALVSTTSCQNNKYTGSCKLNNSVDSISYALGFVQASQLRDMAVRSCNQFDTINMVSFAAAFDNSKLSDEFMKWAKNILDTISVEHYKYGFSHQLAQGKGYIDQLMIEPMLNKKVTEIRSQKAQAAIPMNQKFLEENAKKEGVVTLESGLQYKVITEGTGAKPTLEDRVKVHYHGTLIDGTVFDSSVERGEPIELALQGVIKGWTEALQLMPVGSKWTIYVPASLGYGEEGAGSIPGNSTLIFDIELLEIVK